MGALDRLKDLGLALPEAFAPAGNYMPAVLSGGLLWTAGHVPRRDGDFVHQGVVGDDLTLEDGQDAARLCALGALATVQRELGDLDAVRRVVKVTGFIRSAPGFSDQPKVLNGASDLLIDVYGDAGRHARSAVGVNELPLGVAVEVEFVFAVNG